MFDRVWKRFTLKIEIHDLVSILEDWNAYVLNILSSYSVHRRYNMLIDIILVPFSRLVSFNFYLIRIKFSFTIDHIG